MGLQKAEKGSAWPLVTGLRAPNPAHRHPSLDTMQQAVPGVNPLSCR